MAMKNLKASGTRDVNITKHPSAVYDEPKNYSVFTGGINSNPSTEALRDNELQDGVNYHYNEGILEQRLGALEMMTFDNMFPENEYDVTDPQVPILLTKGVDKDNIQGVFAFGIGSTSYIVIACSGRLFYCEPNLDVNPPYYSEQHGGLWVDPANSPNYFKELFIDLDTNYTVASPGVMSGNYLAGLVEGTEFTNDPHDGSWMTRDKLRSTNSSDYTLVFQNKELIEAVATTDKLYIATGTRFLEVSEITSGTLQAKVVAPHKVNGFEFGNIGHNRLSPYPTLHIENEFDAPATKLRVLSTTDPQVNDSTSGLPITSIMDFAQGESESDYYFKWEVQVLSANKKPLSEWNALNLFKDVGAKGKDEHVYAHSQLATAGITDLTDVAFIRIRATFAEKFLTDVDDIKKEIDGDWEKDVIHTYGSSFTTLPYKGSDAVDALTIDQTFLNIHSCTKLIADGNKIILYDDSLGTGNWYKTVIDNPGYITDGGILNFQTHKNEDLVKVALFEGNLVAFGYNRDLGGSISVVTGNGDDYNAGNYFSPYNKKIAHTDLSTDHPNSVQVAENTLIFKHRDTIYAIDSKQLDADRIDLRSLNDKINHLSSLGDVSEGYNTDWNRMPNIHNERTFGDVPYAKRIFSEITEDYYSIIYPSLGLRWKMYFKLPVRYENDPKIYYPWLRDLSTEHFHVKATLNVNGVSTMFLDNLKLVQFRNTIYKDGVNDYNNTLLFKAYDLGYPKFTKFLKKLNIFYFRHYTNTSDITVAMYNENNDEMLSVRSAAFLDVETDTIQYSTSQAESGQILIGDVTPLPEDGETTVILGPAPAYNSKVIVPTVRSPFTSISVKITSKASSGISVTSLGFDYVTTGLPDDTAFNNAANIITL